MSQEKATDEELPQDKLVLSSLCYDSRFNFELKKVNPRFVRILSDSHVKSCWK